MNITTCRTSLAFFMGATLALIVLLTSTMDYQIALEQENERLRAQLAPKPNVEREAYQAILCPSGNSMAQRIDKRRWDGVITKSYWKRVCA